MPSSGTPSTGFCVGLGPYECGNCQKMKGQFCLDKDVAKDPQVDQQRKQSQGVLVGDKPHDICCNEFLSLKDKQKWDGATPMRSPNKPSSKLVEIMATGKRTDAA